jgi:NADP-dependent 3-hydroxy acid dehydrogenase YdfG/acyl carrier protein
VVAEDQSQSYDSLVTASFYSLLYLTQSLGEFVSESVQMAVASNSLQQVGNESVLFPERAMLHGLCRVIPQEYPSISCMTIDFLLTEPGTREEALLLENLICDLTDKPTYSALAYRQNFRWVQVFEPVKLTTVDGSHLPLRERGVYLITGGLGGIGLELAHYLAHTVHAKLVLIGRSAPSEDALERLSDIESLGAEVIVLNADVTDLGEMSVVKEQALQRFSKIDGAIHAAGIAGGGLIQLKTQAQADAVLSPKVKGTRVLKELFDNENLDFLLLCSSGASIFGGIGQADYCAANAFLDAVAYSASGRTVSVNWDAWQEVGMAVKTAVPVELRQARKESLAQGILVNEGIEAFARILASGLSNVIVSTRDLDSRIRQTNSLKLDQQMELIRPASGPVFPRPALKSEYVEPRNELEQTIAEIWRQLLGIERVGIHDNFFDLGGHSLLAIQIISRLRNSFYVTIPLRTLLERPTVAELAVAVVQEQAAQEDQSELAELLTRLEELPDPFKI